MRAALVSATLLYAAVLAVAEPQLSVDANDLVAHITPLNGVNCGPLEFSGQLAGQNLEALYRQMGIPLIRAHDLYGPCDFATIFPSSLTGWNGDAYSDAGYDFASSDDAIEAMEDAGAEIMFRLGDSWNNDNPRDEHPPDFGLVAHVCRHIVQHYGADSGRILMWEIWNEPDHPMFWEQIPTPAEAMREFYTLYSICAKKLKGKWPTLTVGGPGMAGGTTEQIADDAGAFARACRIKNAPLDFYSWHSYNRNGDGPYIFAQQAQAVRAALDAEGFEDTMNVLSEWNVASVHTTGQQGDLRWNMDGAAFTAAALTYLHQYSDVRYACRYRGDWHTGDEGFGLVNGDGSLKLPGLAFVAYSGLFPQWLLVTRPEMYRLGSDGGDTEGRAIIGTTDDRRRCVNILVSL